MAAAEDKYGNYLSALISVAPDTTLRAGQVADNMLHDMHPDVAIKINNTDDDPFYNNGKLPAFLDRVEQELRDV